MAPTLQAQALEFRALAQRLKETGQTRLRTQLNKAIREAVKPLAEDIKDPAHLMEDMPDSYVPALLRDLKVTTFSQAGEVSVQAQARTPRGNYRKVIQREEGMITHPVFGNRKRWEIQLRGMRSGFFSGPVREHGPRIRDATVAAMHDVAQKIAKG